MRRCFGDFEGVPVVSRLALACGRNGPELETRFRRDFFLQFQQPHDVEMTPFCVTDAISTLCAH